MFFLGLVANFLPISDKGRWVLSGLALVGAIIWFIGYMRAKDAKPQHDKTVNISGQEMSGNVAAAGRDVHQMIYHAGAPQTPQITFTITADYTCYSDNQWASGPVRFLHAKVSIDHGSVLCSALLTKITKGYEVKWEHGPEQLTFGDHTPGDTLPRRLHHGFDYNLDVLVIDCQTSEIQVCNDRRHWLRRPRMHEIFAEKGDYILTIGLAGDGAQSRTAEFRFNWTGNWQTAFLHSTELGDTTPRTTIELLDDLILDGESIEGFCGDMCDGEIGKRKVDAWIAKVRQVLRSNAPDYVASFNDAVEQGGADRLYPPNRHSRTVVEMGEWASDRVRQKAWQLAYACSLRLKEIRKKMRAKLPL